MVLRHGEKPLEKLSDDFPELELALELVPSFCVLHIFVQCDEGRHEVAGDSWMHREERFDLHIVPPSIPANNVCMR